MGRLFALRERLRSISLLGATAYMAQSLWFAFRPRVRVPPCPRGRGVALCLRFRNEARYLDEWLSYHQAAGVEHFFLYNNFSDDHYRSVLVPWIAAGTVTLIDWSKIPASPSAEEDCIRRAAGRFAWVGFIDADEFVVVRNGARLEPFLMLVDAFHPCVAVALHWYMYGSSGHRERPNAPVIEAYQRRSTTPNRHVKVFVRPEEVTACRNSHAFFYRRAAIAVNERGDRVYGSLRTPATAEAAWINHYYAKSAEDYLAKAAQRPTLDRVGIRYPTRRAQGLEGAMAKDNDVVDACALQYMESLRQTSTMS